MPAYLLFIREEPIEDVAEMEEYRRKLRTNPPESSKLNPLVLNGTTELLEGDSMPSSIVIFEFPTADDAKSWYDTPAYQDALPHRVASGTVRVMIVEGITPEAFLAESQPQS